MIDNSSIYNKGVQLGETSEIFLLLNIALTIATSADDPNENTHFYGNVMLHFICVWAV